MTGQSAHESGPGRTGDTQSERREREIFSVGEGMLLLERDKIG